MQGQDLVVAGRRQGERLVEGHVGLAVALLGLAAPGGLDQHLSHGAGGDPGEVQAGDGPGGRRAGELDPRLIDERGGPERHPRLAPADRGGQPVELLVGGAEEAVEGVPIREGERVVGVELDRGGGAALGHDGLSCRIAQ